ncbi:MAG: Fe-S cluster assembly ATPase SufC [Methanophagales archaeon]|nr:Fe-S cluster assembly ATPase SufC [Methanophagales archaeon]
MLEVTDLWVSVADKEVLRGLNLSIRVGETHALLGPNACGKSTLAMTLIGYPQYKVKRGTIYFEGRNLAGKSIYEREKLGIALAYQAPPAVMGVKLRDMIRFSAGKSPWNPLLGEREEFSLPFIRSVGLAESFIERDVNLGFSGGEKKKSELAQLFAMRPELMILDEPDSGVDIDALKLIGNELGTAIEEFGSSALLITHHRHILQYLRVNVAHIMHEGRIISSGEPERILPKIEELGYEGHLKEVVIAEGNPFAKANVNG